MIYCLTGELIVLDALTYTAVIDCAGVGYKVNITGNTLTNLSNADRSRVRVYTHMQVREDAVELYGFHDTKEADAFRMLITVSGVGPKAAMSILTALTPDALSLAIASGDAKAISKAQGVGGKIAARVVLELKDKFQKAFPVEEIDMSGVLSPAQGSVDKGGGKIADARDALMVLGFSRAEATSALGKVSRNGSVEDMIRDALAHLMK